MLGATPADWAALGLWIVIAVLGWISWGLVQNQRVIVDRRRGVALGIGLAVTIAKWCEVVLMREPPGPAGAEGRAARDHQPGEEPARKGTRE